MSFKKVEDEGILPGPRALFISGFNTEDVKKMKQFLKDAAIEGVNIFPCREDSLDLKVSEALEDKATAPLVEAAKLPPVMLWSGIEHKELDKALKDFQETGLKRPIFATTTIPNMDFTIKELLQHLIGEQKSIREAMKKQS